MLRARILLVLILSQLGLAQTTAAKDGGHGDLRASFEAGAHESLGSRFTLGFRLALHDFLDRQTEFQTDTLFELFSGKVDFFGGNSQFYLDELTVVRVARMVPLSSRWNELTWKIEVGGRTVKELLCNRCGAGNILGGLGAAFTLSDTLPITAWVLFEAELLGSPAFSGFPLKPSFGPRIGLRFQPTPWLNGIAYGLYRYQASPISPHVFNLGTEWRLALGPDWAVNAVLYRLSDGWQGGLGALAYF